jgi:hypothetical protein
MADGFIKGVVGKVRWAYYDAAAINGYTVTRSGHDWTLRGTVVLSDAFKMTQRPLTFVAPHEQGEWCWDILSHELSNGILVAKLAAPVTKGKA